MSSIGTILGTARSAMAAHQLAVQVTAQNVANAEVEGYSRQRLAVEASVASRTQWGAMGTGVRVRDLGRVRDGLLDEGFRREAAGAAEHGMRRDLLHRLEGVFGEPSERGLASSMDAFWSAWSDLSSHPGNPTARGVVQQRGAQLAFVLNNQARQLGDLRENTVAKLRASLGELNDLTGQVAALNQQIQVAELGGTSSAPDLRDSRDRLVDRIAALAPTRAIERPDGSVAVYVESVTAVDGSSSKTFTLDGPPYAVREGSGVLPRLGGSLGAMLEVLNTELPGALARLDELARGLVAQVNEVHQRGWSAKGDLAGSADWTDPDPALRGSRVPFFDPATTSARDIALSALVAADRDYVAVGRTQNGPGDNSVALELAGLRTVGGMAAGESFADHYRSTVSGVALRAGSADGSATVHETLALQADTRRQSVSGVSVDEELTQLMRHQQAYAAAVKLVNAADEMAQAVLAMV